MGSWQLELCTALLPAWAPCHRPPSERKAEEGQVWAVNNLPSALDGADGQPCCILCPQLGEGKRGGGAGLSPTWRVHPTTRKVSSELFSTNIFVCC